MSLATVVAEADVVVCCGTGGVGKTSTAAALALAAARTGRRAVVVTIDPARRLADALGLHGGLTNEPRRIELAPGEQAGASEQAAPRAGELWAMMLDTEATFDALVERHAGSPDQAARILRSHFYRNVAGALSGTQEYMAMEKLHELHASGRFDLVVVDTPPTRNALAFVDAPRLLTRLLDNRLYRLLVAPSRGVVRAATTAVQTVVRPLTRVVGAEVIDDAVSFFRAFEGMEDGFRRRADDVLHLLRADRTAFVVVATPREDTIAEAATFARQLRATGIAVRAAVVNRTTPRFGDVDVAVDERVPHTVALADFRATAAGEDQHIAQLAAALGPVPVVRVPLLALDVHDLDGVATIAGLLGVGAGESA